MSALAPIDRDKSLGAHVYDRLKRALMSGAFQPGQKLTVRSVAEDLQVSVTPAREGLNRLIDQGALEMPSAKTILVPVLTVAALKEVATIRRSLEGTAAELATANFGPSDIANLLSLQAELESAMNSGDYRRVLDRNESFHFGVYEKCGMPRLVGLIEAQWLRVGPSLNMLYPEFAVSRRGVSNHMRVLEGLQKRDAQAVRAAFEHDIDDGYATLSAALGKT
ncbi:GntR family transcriptional regulator [Peristeroidobacter soli]|jgi:DNA-binding GntR family transcriptional regulator|uniref:GntR family transcriptional regulator n=1 Tax=Peristeroidobacter soli TaxID=2497877 RepID=UPI00101D4FC8|nr:GntR family transcriptional regulator [Peristeroidobacter soli]